jgi:CTP synthase
VATQAHPELKSRPNRPHPLFRDFVGAAAAHAGVRAETAESIEVAAPASPSTTRIKSS